MLCCSVHGDDDDWEGNNEIESKDLPYLVKFGLRFLCPSASCVMTDFH